MELEGKVGFITGAASGIGRATAVAMCTAGARVTLVDTNPAGLAETCSIIEKTGGQVLSLVCDVSDADAVRRAIDRTVEQFGRLDSAVNNAGVLGDQTLFHEYDLASFKRVLEINFWGVVHCMQAELKPMLAQGSGTIVNIASGAGLVGWPQASAYVASKHAVVGLTKSAGVEYASRGIRINALCPAFVYTGMTDPLLAAAGAEDAVVATHPIGRIARPEEIADAVVWLSSGRSTYMAAANIPIDGGYTAQ